LLVMAGSWYRQGDHLIKWPTDKFKIPEITRCMVEEIITFLLETRLKMLLQVLMRGQDI
jgi:hypothetical protein